MGLDGTRTRRSPCPVHSGSDFLVLRRPRAESRSEEKRVLFVPPPPLNKHQLLSSVSAVSSVSSVSPASGVSTGANLQILSLTENFWTKSAFSVFIRKTFITEPKRSKQEVMMTQPKTTDLPTCLCGVDAVNTFEKDPGLAFVNRVTLNTKLYLIRVIKIITWMQE